MSRPAPSLSTSRRVPSLSLCPILSILLVLLHQPYQVLSTCQQCALTGKCTTALPNDQPGTFCATTIANNRTTYLCCPLSLTCLPSPTQSAHFSCQHSLSSLHSSSSSSDTSTGVSVNSYVTYAFIAVSLLFAAFLVLLICCVCCNVIVACSSEWRRQWRWKRARKRVMPVENEQERRDREEREEKEREELERQHEQREEARVKQERMQREREEMDVIVQRAREQVERRRRERQLAAVQRAMETSEDQRTMEGTEADTSATKDVTIDTDCNDWVDEVELV